MNSPGTQNGLRCPACQVSLVMTDRQNIEIDYCPQCRGVWLDRGELDKIIERSLEAQVPQRPEPPVRREEYDRDHYRRDDHHKREKYEYPRRKSWLSELFD